MNVSKKWRKIRLICMLVFSVCFIQLTAFLIQANGESDDLVSEVCPLEGIYIQALDIKVKEGDVWNPMEGVSIRTQDSEELSSECIKQNLEISFEYPFWQPFVDENNIVQYIGNHTMEITVKNKEQEFIASTSRTVYVDGKPRLFAYNQEFNIEDGLDSKRIIECANGGFVWYDESNQFQSQIFEYNSDVPAGTPNVISSEIVEGPSKQINQQGLYRIKHSVSTNDGEYVECYSQVVIKPEISISDLTGFLKINANSFQMSLEEVNTLGDDVQAMIQRSKARAYEMDDNIDIISTGVDYKDITNLISIDPIDLQDIKNSSEIGGTYPLTFYVEKNGKYVSKKISVAIGVGETATKAVQTQEGTDLSITAHSFQIDFETAKQLNEKDAIKNGNAKAMILNSAKELSTVSVNTAQLGAIQHAPKEGGVFDLTYQVIYQDKTGVTTSYDTTIQVEVVRKGFSTTKKQYTKKANTSPQTSDYTKIQTMFIIVLLSGYAIYASSKRIKLK